MRGLHFALTSDPPTQRFATKALLGERDLLPIAESRVVAEDDFELIEPIVHAISMLAIEDAGLAQQLLESGGVIEARGWGHRKEGVGGRGGSSLVWLCGWLLPMLYLLQYGCERWL